MDSQGDVDPADDSTPYESIWDGRDAVWPEAEHQKSSAAASSENAERALAEKMAERYGTNVEDSLGDDEEYE